jgi:heme oxygenase
MVRNKSKVSRIEQQLRDFEARLRRQMLREKLDAMGASFETGSMPRIHVTLEALAASRPAEAEYETVSGD